MSNRRTLLIAAIGSALAGTAGVASAQAYPSKPVRLVVPFAPGGTTDIVARVVSEKIGASLGQTMIVENKAGGGGSVGDDRARRARWLFVRHGDGPDHRRQPAINLKPPYNPITDFTPIINVAATPNVIAVHRALARDYKGFRRAEEEPGKYSY
jgi:tripartite-type tricarboxylate transporter receptor subunit TctC